MRKVRRKIPKDVGPGLANMGIILMFLLCLIVVLYALITVIRLVF